jgi:signal transduction histidine kinase
MTANNTHDNEKKRACLNSADQCTQTIGYVASLEEEVRKLSARLRESENGKSAFLSNVRNEINNPLASIIGLAASITGLPIEEKVKKLSALIQKQASHLDFQMRNIIMAAEIEMGEVHACGSRVNVASLIESLIEYFKHKLQENNIEVTCNIPNHLKFRTDAHLLQTIMINLLANAIEFCGHQKRVDVAISTQSRNLNIRVTDYGAGIDFKMQQEIFQRFMQGESGLCKAHRGHGLGLSIVHGLVNHLGGTLSLVSAIGEGTKVTIEIPEMLHDCETGISSSFGNELLFTTDEEF